MAQVTVEVSGLLFDMDGVLVSSIGSVLRSWRKWAKHYGLPNPDKVEIPHGVRAIDIMTELKELTDAVTKDKGNARTPLATCAVNGQLLGIAKASRDVAAECYDPGKKRDDLVAALSKVVQDMEGAIGATCR